MPAINISLKDWLFGWLVTNPTNSVRGTVGIQGVALVDSTGAEYNAANPLPVGPSAGSAYTFGRVTADGQIKAGTSTLHTISIAPIGVVAAGVLTVYNSLTETGTVIFSTGLPATTFTPFTVTLDVAASTGIYIGFDGSLANVQVTVSYR